MYLAVGGGSLRSPAMLRRPKCAALAALGLMRASGHADAIADSLADKSHEVKLCSLEALAQLGEAEQRQAMKVVPLLEDDLYIVRVKACDCLAALKAEDAICSTIDLFEDASPSVRKAALHTLATCPEVAAKYSAEVYKCMSDEYGIVRAAAMAAFGTMGLVGQSYASVIAMELTSQDPYARAAACEALAKLGDHGAAFAEEVAACQQDSLPLVRFAAAAALDSMSNQVKMIENHEAANME